MLFDKQQKRIKAINAKRKKIERFKQIQYELALRAGLIERG